MKIVGTENEGLPRRRKAKVFIFIRIGARGEREGDVRVGYLVQSYSEKGKEEGKNVAVHRKKGFAGRRRGKKERIKFFF